MYEWTGSTPQPDFDQTLVESFIGKYILIGLTYLAHDGSSLAHGLQDVNDCSTTDKISRIN